MPERRLAAIMFTDIVGSTAVTGRSEAAGLALRDRHRELVRTQVERYRGRFVEAPGDESLDSERQEGSVAATVPAFSGEPAIAVLPFENLSGDPEQEYFADGIAEDLITRLSAFRRFPVIARNSTFVYKGKAVNVREISRELDVRYVVHGSVRKIGDRVRISAQLIDASTSHHVWAERYDRELRDVFAIQDEITRAIGGAVQEKVWGAEVQHAVRRQPGSLDAWDALLKAVWHYRKTTRTDLAKARAFVRRAVELDPSFALAWALLAFTYDAELSLQWAASPEHSVRELGSAATRAVEVDETEPNGHMALALYHSLRGETDKAIERGRLAIRLSPGSVDCYTILGRILAISGNADEAIACADTAARLSPQDPEFAAVLMVRATAYFSAGRYQEAADSALESRGLNPGDPYAKGLIAASYAHLGRLDDASVIFRDMPDFSADLLRRVLSSASADFVDRLIDGLRKAGLNE